MKNTRTYYTNEILFSELENVEFALPEEVVSSFKEARRLWKVHGEDYSLDDHAISSLIESCVPELELKGMKEILLELSLLNADVRHEFEKRSIEGQFFSIARDFLEKGRYGLGNKATIWDYAYSFYWHALRQKTDDLEVISFLKSDQILLDDPYLVPSLISGLIDSREDDEGFLRTILSQFGHFSSVRKKVEKALKRFR
ncbi:MAG: hypothetical protein RLZZ519_1459 [Bacteroidota bacterium]|jgi:hypothetical protein